MKIVVGKFTNGADAYFSSDGWETERAKAKKVSASHAKVLLGFAEDQAIESMVVMESIRVGEP